MCSSDLSSQPPVVVRRGARIAGGRGGLNLEASATSAYKQADMPKVLAHAPGQSPTHVDGQGQTYAETLDAAGIDTASLELDHKGTLVAPGDRERTAPDGPLPLLTTADAAERPADVRLREVLGTGGMGRVFAADQVCLARPVAVKMLKPERSEEPRLNSSHT